ncbi:exo-beta-N-acetylmuramidase NamZ family protein [Rufibacter immobilis]|uniref:exo-beta-N-acetylmuramidase NamZ family protein n=1 Tax=Rufibacter immobilis TaxID=1348778 RepID=UPI0035EA2BE0
MTKPLLSYLSIGFLTLLLGSSACTKDTSTTAITTSSQSSSTSAKAKPRLITGADQTQKYVPYLRGKKVGMVVNPTSIIGDKPSVDSLLALGVQVVKVFGPEHGFRGNASNGTHVGDEVDEKTGIPIISLYGKKKKPSKEDLAGIDVLIYDIQDVGVRFYTNINTLRDVMEAAAEHKVEFMVLDRPNPHGYLIDGPILDMKHKSGIGQFPIPIAHGVTVGEFAQMINGEGWLANGLKLDKINVIKLANYHHDMPYMLPVKPSPNLNTAQSVMLYPSTCLFEGTILNHGRGTQYPFTVLGAPALQGKYAFSYTPVSIPGMSESPLHMNELCYGLDLRNYDVEQLRRKRQINISWLLELYNAYPQKEKFFDSSYSKQMGVIEKLVGVTEFRKQVQEGWSEERIRETWQPGLAAYREMRKKYLLYP